MTEDLTLSHILMTFKLVGVVSYLILQLDY